MIGNMEVAWELYHRVKDIYHLSDNSLATILEYLDIEGEYKAADSILEIGVGTAKCSEEIADSGRDLWCVDVSKTALDRVRPFARAIHTKDLSALPTNLFDLAIEFCVVQHIDNKELYRHLKYALRSLKTTGTYALQFAYEYNGDLNDQDTHDEWTMVAGRCGRTLAFMEKAVSDNGGEVTWASIPNVNSKILGWHSIKVRKNG